LQTLHNPLLRILPTYKRRLPLAHKTATIIRHRIFLLHVLLLTHLGHNSCPKSCAWTIRDDERLPEERCDDFEPRVWKETNTYTPWDAQDGDNDANCPLVAVDTYDAKCCGAVHCDENLCGDHDDIHRDEIVIFQNADEDVEFVVQASVVVLIENLEPDKHVEDYAAHLVFWVGQEVRAGEVHDEGGGDLEDGLADYHFPHCEGDDGGGAGCWGAVEDFRGWGVGGEGEGCKGVPSKPLA
jgi:hypothetical protein